MDTGSERQPHRRERAGWVWLAWVPLAWIVLAFVADVASLLLAESDARLASLEASLRAREGGAPVQAGEVPVVGEADAALDVWLLGASSVVLPEPRGVAVSLQGALTQEGLDVRVTNLGRSGMDLSDLVRHLEGHLLATDDPADVLVLYAGHNEFNKAHHRTGWGGPMHWTLSLPFAIAVARGDRPCPSCSWRDHFEWWRRTHAVSWLHALQAWGLWRPDPDFWARHDEVVLDGWERRVNRLVDLASARGVRVVLETPVGDLSRQPYGFDASIARLRDEAAGATTLAERTALLQRAEDLELYTPDIRARSALYGRMRALGDARGIAVFDLADAFVQAGIPRDAELFSDYFHYRPAGHAAHHRVFAPWFAAWARVEGLVPSPGADAGPEAPPDSGSGPL